MCREERTLAQMFWAIFRAMPVRLDCQRERKLRKDMLSKRQEEESELFKDYHVYWGCTKMIVRAEHSEEMLKDYGSKL